VFVYRYIYEPKEISVGTIKKKAVAKLPNVKEYQFWRYDNIPLALWSNKVI
jgi:hypothetical protein